MLCSLIEGWYLCCYKYWHRMPPCDMLEIGSGENLTMVLAGNQLTSSVNHSAKTIHHHHLPWHQVGILVYILYVYYHIFWKHICYLSSLWISGNMTRTISQVQHIFFLKLFGLLSNGHQQYSNQSLGIVTEFCC